MHVLQEYNLQFIFTTWWIWARIFTTLETCYYTGYIHQVWDKKRDLHHALRLLKRVIILAVFRKLFSINETQSSLQIEIIVDKIRDKCAPSWHPFFSLYMTMNLVMKSDHISFWSNHAKENCGPMVTVDFSDLDHVPSY